MMRAERSVYESAAGAPFMPRLLGSYEDEELVVLAIEDLRGARWPPPYPEDATPLLATVAEIAGVAPPDALPALQERDELFWERVGADPSPLLALGACSRDWLTASLPALVETERRWTQAGDDLVHNDIWSGNICFVDGDRPLLVDWGGAVRADRRVDLAWTLLQVRTHSLRAELALADEDVCAAYATGELVVTATEPLPSWAAPGSTLRAEQARFVRPALEWVASTLGLPSP